MMMYVNLDLKLVKAINLDWNQIQLHQISLKKTIALHSKFVRTGTYNLEKWYFLRVYGTNFFQIFVLKTEKLKKIIEK